MVKAVLDKVSSPSRSEMKKQRKKMAKQEARTKQALEQARKDVQKAEQKIAKAQMKFEARNTHLRNLEAKLSKMHHKNQEQDTSDGSTESQQVEAEPAKDTSDEEKKERELDEIAQATHVPTPPQSVTPWPPLEIREEVAESAEKEYQESSSTATPTSQEASLLPAEERADGPQQEGSSQNNPQSQISSSTPTLQETPLPSEEGQSDNPQNKNEELARLAQATHVPTPQNTENAWPPIKIREEVIEAADAESTGEEQNQ